MKKGYKRLLIYEIILILILFLVNIFNIFKGFGYYKNLIIIISFFICFKFLFGFEKDNHRYVKDILMEVFIVTIFSFIIYYLSGLVIGFGRVRSYLNINGITNFILPILLIRIVTEYFRYNVIVKSEGSKLLIGCSIILFILLDIVLNISSSNFRSLYSGFNYVALTILPSVSKSIVASYICSKIGPKPNLIWLIIIDLYLYFLPIAPNCGNYINSLLRLLFPIIVGLRVHKFFDKEIDKEVIRENKKSNNLIPVLSMFVIVSTLIYFTSGLFRYHVMAVGSDSMYPVIMKGDAVIVYKKQKLEDLKVDDVIAFNNGGVVIIHRINQIESDGNKLYFYTKGDFNKDRDGFPVTENMILGKVLGKIPYIGLPSVWLNELN